MSSETTSRCGAIGLPILQHSVKRVGLVGKDSAAYVCSRSGLGKSSETELEIPVFYLCGGVLPTTPLSHMG